MKETRKQAHGVDTSRGAEAMNAMMSYPTFQVESDQLHVVMTT